MKHGKGLFVIWAAMMVAIAPLQGLWAAESTRSPSFYDARSLLISFLREEFDGNTRFRKNIVQWYNGKEWTEGYTYAGGETKATGFPNSQHLINEDSCVVVTDWKIVDQTIKNTDRNGNKVEDGAISIFDIRFYTVGLESFHYNKDSVGSIKFLKFTKPYYEYITLLVEKIDGKLKIRSPTKPHIGLGALRTDIKEKIMMAEKEIKKYQDNGKSTDLEKIKLKHKNYQEILSGLDSVTDVLPAPEFSYKMKYPVLDLPPSKIPGFPPAP